MGSMTDSTSSRRPSIDAVQFGHLVEAEERRFKECLERVVRNGVDDKAGTAELAAISNRYDALVNIQRGYLRD